MPYVNPLNPLMPAGTDPVGEGAARMRELRAGLEERFSTIFEDFPDGEPLTLKIVGPLAERPDPTKGAVYYAEDVNRFFVADSTPAWREPVSAGVVATGASISKMEADGTQLISGTASEIVQFPVLQTDSREFYDDVNHQYVIDEPGVYEVASELRILIDTDNETMAREFEIIAELQMAFGTSSYLLAGTQGMQAQDFRYETLAEDKERFYTLALRTNVRVPSEQRRFRVRLEQLRGWPPPFATVRVYLGSWFTVMRVGN